MSDRKQQILETTAAILRHKSFSAFSYADLEHELGIRKASIHHHFATKETLALALLDFYSGNARALLGQLVDSQPTPGARLGAFLDAAEDMLVHGEGNVCPHAVFEVDAHQLPTSVLDRVAQLQGDYIAGLAQLLDVARDAGQATFDGDATDQATMVMAALQGARGMILPGEEPTRFRSVVAQLKRAMGLTSA